MTQKKSHFGVNPSTAEARIRNYTTRTFEFRKQINHTAIIHITKLLPLYWWEYYVYEKKAARYTILNNEPLEHLKEDLIYTYFTYKSWVLYQSNIEIEKQKLQN